VDHQLRRKRVAALLPELGADAMLVTRLPNVRYLSGFTGSNGQLVVTPDSGVLFTDGRYAEQSRREAPGLERIVYSNGFAGALGRSVREIGVTGLGFEPEGLTYKVHAELSAKLEGVTLVPVEQAIERFRREKEPEELALIGLAQQAADAAFDEILGRLAEGVTERELALELELAMRRAGADGVAFETIVAFGQNAAEPHHDPTDRGLTRGDVVKMDFGARSAGYHSDMTRTVAFGEPPDELRIVHRLVRRAQEAGISAIRAGVVAEEVDRAARAVIEEAGYGEAFGHSLGHGVGLEIHEGPWLRRRNDDPLPAGAVVTVEPGVYLPGLGGVRIEDMVEVTEDGARVMPRSTRDLVRL
jgi:Xaa-Pro aminopeptidase